MITKTRTAYHITLDDAKQHLRIDAGETFDDEQINQMIQQAVEIAENYIEKSIAVTTCEMTIYDFIGDVIRVPEGNYLSVTSVKDGDDVEYDVEQVRIYDDHFEIELDTPINVDSLVVTFETGYSVGSCPGPIKRAVLVKVADLYDTERGSYTLSLQNNKTFEMILNYYKPYRFTYFRET